ncbi:MAG TPA: pyruvate:ferredoxin (flavodoxin) oxidoreductase [Opitutaceae bacterium]|nr:pyruvate:ferredoxin (flavodoxin) oxidoreductase [Opitutaceae bacterium]
MKTAVPSSVSTLDGNEAVSAAAYRLSEIFAIYPITPSSPMAEYADEWAVAHQPNIWGQVPEVVELQSEGGASGAVHGTLQAGVLASTFTASQGLLLMIPNMYKIAGELTPCVIHVSARTLATHALSIFGDHSDVMACRQCGWAMLASNSPQEAHDLAAIAHAATLRTRVPFLHFFDGFRTSHEVNTVSRLSDDTLRALIDAEALAAFRRRGLTPDRPVLRGTAQNPDVFFQARESINRYYDVAPSLTQETMDQFAKLTGRNYHLFDYEGHPEADRVIVIMGSGAETAAETATWLNANGEKAGVLKVRLYRPFSAKALAAALPRTVRAIAVLDRTKEPGAVGEPLYVDVVTALREAEVAGWFSPRGGRLTVIGGRYGLSSKEFTPAMVLAVFAELGKPLPKNPFTVGIHDDVTGLSLNYDPAVDIEPSDRTRAVFFGLGSDGTVGANKNTIKIIGEEAGKFGQGYFVYDSKKSGSATISHLRFGDQPVRAPYLVYQADFLACHHFSLLEVQPVLDHAAPGGVFLLNAPGPVETLWERLTVETQQQIIAKKLRFYAIDAGAVARACGLGGRINTIMQTCFFALSRVLPLPQALESIKKSIKKSYGRQGEEVVKKNAAAVDSALEALREVPIPAGAASVLHRPPPVPEDAPDFVRNVTAVMLSGRGDELPVSAFPPDGTWPTATSRWEKRNIADEIPVWDAALCIQCNKCVEICPHAAIRAKYYPPAALAGAPAAFHSTDFRSPEVKGMRYTLQVAPEDCTGCELCVQFCPVKDKTDPKRKAINMQPQAPLRAAERQNFEFFLRLPSPDRAALKLDQVKSAMFLDPLFEFSGACSGCGETPYLKMLTQLFGDRAVIANATGCSSIYGGNLPTTPYSRNQDGRGPAWSNSLFEDNAEFGLGLRLGLDRKEVIARDLLQKLAARVGPPLVEAILKADQTTEAGIAAQRARVVALRDKLAELPADATARELGDLADYLVKKSVWVVGGDGWAYDIGYGGLDHVLASGRKVNVLVLDTEVYSNTGGQCSKATPLGAAARFSMGGKAIGKKDLGLLAMTYGSIYVARVALGARDTQTLAAFREADSYPGPSLVIAFAHCIAHGYSLIDGIEHQKLAVETGYWPLFRYDPRRADRGENPLMLDSPAPKVELINYTKLENRFRMLEKKDPNRSHELDRLAQAEVSKRVAFYQKLAAMQASGGAVSVNVPVAMPAPKAPPKNGDGPATIKSVTSG